MTVRTDPAVLARLISRAVLALPAVVRAATVSTPGARAAAVAVRLTDAGASVDCFVVARPDTRLPELAAAIRLMAAGAAELAGIPLREANVFVQDVEDARG